MKYKNKVHSKKLLRKHLRSFYEQATEEQIRDGLSWYASMHEWCEQKATAFDLPAFKVAGIFAALSPQMSVPHNKDLTIQFLRSGSASHYGFLVDKCIHIKNLPNNEQDKVTSILSGNKISSFYLNLQHPMSSTAVTVDRHALGCLFQTPMRTKALPESFTRMTDQQYIRFADLYKQVAHQVGVLPHQLQAITWTVYRDKRELAELKIDNVPF